MAIKTKPDEEQAEPPQNQPNQQIPLRDDPYAPIIYTTELAGGGVQGENFNLTFAALLYDHSEGMTRVYRKTNLRLVIPKIAIPTVINFLQQLHGGDASKTPVNKKGKPTLQ